MTVGSSVLLVFLLHEIIIADVINKKAISFIFIVILLYYHVSQNPTSGVKPLVGVGFDSLCGKRTAAQSRLTHWMT